MERFFSSKLVANITIALVAILGAGGTSAQVIDPPATYRSGAPKLIPGRYIVVFKDHVTDAGSEAEKVIRNEGGVRHFTFSKGLKGFVATLPDGAVAKVRNDPIVDFVEQDQIATINVTENLPTGGWDLTGSIRSIARWTRSTTIRVQGLASRRSSLIPAFAQVTRNLAVAWFRAIPQFPTEMGPMIAMGMEPMWPVPSVAPHGVLPRASLWFRFGYSIALVLARTVG